MSAPNEDCLPDAEGFEDDHLSEAAVVLLADGATALVSARVAEHGAGCPACASRIGEAALASVEVHAAFVALAEVEGRAGLEGRAEVEGRAGLDVAAGLGVAAAVQTAGTTRGRARRGHAAWAIGSGLVLAAVASAPTLSGLARGIGEIRHGLEVLVTVSVQLEQALRLASGRLETVRMGASWAATFALVAVGVWIARRKPRAADNGSNEVVAR